MKSTSSFNKTYFRIALTAILVSIFSIQSFSQLSGSYTIDPSGGVFPNFATFNAAVDSLTSQGVSGTVVFNAVDGTFNEQISIPVIAGASAVNTITFQSQSLDSTMVVLTYSALSLNNFVIELNGADYITFRKMTLQATGASYARVINMLNIANNNNFLNNQINGISTTSTGDSLALVFSGGNNGNNNIFSNNLFQNGSYGIYFYGNFETGTYISNNYFTEQYERAIHLQSQDSPIINENIISTNSTSTSFKGIYCTECNNNLIIQDNKISINNGGANTNGIFIYGISTLGNEGFVADNFINIDFISSTGGMGIFYYQSTFQKFYYNSINITGNNPNTRILFFDSGCSDIVIKNNILTNKANGYSIWSDITTGITSDYNDLYTSGTNVGLWNGTNTTDLLAWRSASSQDANSISTNPKYLSDSDLHIENLSLKAGTPLTEVTDDIDGDLRDATTPFMGADELTGLQIDSLALVALYDSTDGANWTDNLNWLLGNVSTWNGITVSGDRVTQIVLDNNNLVGTIPAEIWNMTNLENITFFVNQISGTIPPEIGNLTNLNHLDLGANQLSGSIPTELTNLTNLTLLLLNNNQFSGSIPTEIGNLTNLNILFLHSNQLSGSIPTEIGSLTNLSQLHLYVNQLSGSIPAEISNLTSLQILSLTENQLTYLPALSSITTLTDLYIQNNQFTFKDIEPNIGVPTFTYSPQDSVGEIIDTTVYTGTSFTLSVSTGGASSQYQWKKDGTSFGSISSDSTYTFNPVAFSDIGAYTCDITNVIAPNLTLYSRPINVHVIDSLILEFEITNSTSINGSDGSIDLTVSEGLSPYTFSWSNSATTEDVSGLSAGVYSVTVTDARNSTATDSIRVYGTFVDDRDGQVYKAITIGDQLWMAENLNATLYADGSPLVDGTGAGDITGDFTTKYYFYYNDDSATYADTYGALYTWAAVMNGATSSNNNPSGVKGVCPDGWYVPSDTAWKELEIYLGMSQVHADSSGWRGTDEGGKLKETDTIHWNNPNNSATNSTGFTALPGGFGSENTSFGYIRDYAIFWSSTDSSSSEKAWDRALKYYEPGINRGPYNKEKSYSVRCVKTFNLHSDSLALVALYDSTNGANWTDKTNWLTGSVSTWYGITVSGDRVTQIDLNSNNLIGTIPPEIGNLSNLQSLHLYTNQLSGSIPTEIGNLTNLMYLYLDNNQLSGSIPTEFSNLTNLQYLILNGNQLTGSIPSEIGNLSNLAYLWLQQNQLSGSIPPEIGNMSNLSILYLANNQLSGSIPPEIGNLSNLTALGIEINQFSGPFPLEICNLTNLEGLNLGSIQLSGSIPTEIGSLTNLQQLNLGNNQLSDSIPTEITNLTSLQTLSLTENQLTYLPVLSSITTLNDLHIQNNKFTFKDIEPNIGVASNIYTYSPQDSVGEIIDTTLYVGTSYTMSVSTGGANSQYQWKKDGINFGSTSSNSTYTFNLVAFSDSGTYICEITNTVATDLTLYSRPTNLDIEVKLCDMISNWEDVTPPWESFNQSVLDVNVVENPDKTGINVSDSSVKLITTTDQFEYMFYNLPGTETWSFNTYPVFKLMVNAPGEGDVVVRFENSNSTANIERQAHYSNPGVWEELIFDFTGAALDGLVKMVIFPDYDNINGGAGWYIDEITHCDLHLNLGVVDLLLPESGCALTNNETVTVKIVNFGVDTVSNFDISYQIDNGSVITETVTSIIDPGDTLNYTFSTNADLYTTEFYKEYFFSVNTMLAGDEGPNNDQYNETIGVYGYYTDREEWTTYGICDGMTGDGGTTGVVEDGSGNIWVGTDEGVSVYNGASWVTYNTANSPLTSNAIETLYADDLGNVWIGTWQDEGGVCRYDGSAWTTYTTENSGIAGNIVEEIIKDSNGNYWFATYNGISKFDGTTIWTTYNTGNSGLVSDYTNAITEDSNGNIWIGTISGVSKFNVTGDTWTTYDMVNSGLGSDYIYAVSEDNQGNIWFGTDGGGISKLNGTTWTTYTTSNSDLPINRVFSIMADSNGNVWFGTFGGGAVKYDGTNWIIYNEENGLVTRSYNDGRIFFWGDIFEDSNANIWFPAYNGLAKKAPVSIEIYNIEYSYSTCNGTNDGSITIYALGENPPLQYSIDGGTTYQFDNVFANLAPGTYPIAVTDGVNTVSTDTVVLIDFNNISTYPFTEDFDSYAVNSTGFDYGWYNETTNKLDWMVYSGATPSIETGPETDQSGSGNYLYLEASANFLVQSSLISPCFDLSGLSNPTLKFYYHMYGAGMGELSLDIYSGGVWTNGIVYISGDQGTDWVQQTVDLSSYSGIAKFRFRGNTGDTFQSDIAIDNIEVTGLSEGNDILTFSFPEQTGDATINAVNHTVDIEVSLSTDITALTATFTISNLATIDISNTSQVSGVTSNDFSSPVNYTVTADDGTTQDWVVTVAVATSLSSENDILSFSFAEQTGDATIDAVNHAVDIEVANGTDVSGLVATFTISDLANITISTTSQVSGVTSNNFTSPVTYTVSAEDDTIRDWVVTVTIETSLSSENDILSFSFAEQTGAATIDVINHKVDIEVANGTNLTNLVATFSISSQASIAINSVDQISGVTANDFTNPVTYTVTAENDTQQDWVVTVTASTSMIISSFPYQKDFETGNEDWYTGGTNSSWEHGIPSAGQTINSAASGTNAWVTNLNGDYNPDEVSYIRSPQFDLSSLDFPKIEFSIWWYAEGFYDGANLQYKLGSDAWKTLGKEESDDSWYNSSYLYSIENGFGFDMDKSAGWSGDDEWGYGSNGWVTVDHALTEIDYLSAYVTFRIAFASNSGYENDGIAFDDIYISDDPTGIDPVETGLSDIQIYPNPNEGKFRLVYNGERDIDLKLQLINLQGQVILSEQIEAGNRYNKEFELEYLSAGIYYFRLMHKEGVVVKKMVVR